MSNGHIQELRQIRDAGLNDLIAKNVVKKARLRDFDKFCKISS